MMKKLLVAVAMMGGVSTAFAAGENNIGTCGWGAKLFDGQRGVAPQVLAVTTNGTSGNQTFGITFGTSGCTQDGVVRSNWKTAMFIDGNKSQLARDMSAGQGESLTTLAALLNVQDTDKAAFFRATKENFARIYDADQISAERLIANLKQVLAADTTLAKYSEQI